MFRFLDFSLLKTQRTLIGLFFFLNPFFLTMARSLVSNHLCLTQVMCRFRPLNQSEKDRGDEFLPKFPSLEQVTFGRPVCIYLLLDMF